MREVPAWGSLSRPGKQSLQLLVRAAMTNEPTAAEIEELRRMVEPIVDAALLGREAGIRHRYPLIVKNIELAAMRVVVQARVDALLVPDYARWVQLKAAEAVVARLKEKGAT